MSFGLAVTVIFMATVLIGVMAGYLGSKSSEKHNQSKGDK